MWCKAISKHNVYHGSHICIFRDHSGYGLGKWEERLHINASSHWLSTYAAWSNNDLLERHAKGKLQCNTTIKTDIHKLFTNCLFLNCDKKTGLNWSSSYQHQIALESHIGQSICLINNTSSQWPRLQRPRYVNVPAGYGFFLTFEVKCHEISRDLIGHFEWRHPVRKIIRNHDSGENLEENIIDFVASIIPLGVEASVVAGTSAGAKTTNCGSSTCMGSVFGGLKLQTPFPVIYKT